MIRTRISGIIPGALLFTAGAIVGLVFGGSKPAAAQAPDQVFELRTYTTHPGRLEALHARFTQHTMRLFEGHGMVNIGYFTPQDAPLAANTLIYVLAHESRDAAAANWQAFVADPEWQSAYQQSVADGPIVDKIDTVFMNPTEYSPIK